MGFFRSKTLLATIANRWVNTSLLLNGILKEKNEGTCCSFKHPVLSLLPFYRSSYALLKAMAWNFNSVLCDFWVILGKEKCSGKPLLHKWLFSWRRWCGGGFPTQFLIWVVSCGPVPNFCGAFRGFAMHVVLGGITWLGISCPLRSPKK